MRQAPPLLDWNALRELRDRFLSPDPLPEPYWISREQMEAYDITLGERIGWKWDAVLSDLAARGWKPPSGELCDFGCGTGIATRRVMGFWPGHFRQIRLWDHSAIAMGFAREKIHEAFPGVKVTLAPSPPSTEGVALISHVLTELPAETADSLLKSLQNAKAVLWVEPGTREVSRHLIHLREKLRDSLAVIAPCTHAERCGLLATENEAHWCHHFAPAPRGAHQDPFWGHFRKELNLDIGPVAYSFLVMARDASPCAPGLSHLIGHTLRSPKFLRALSCQPDAVIQDLVASRRSGSVYRDLKNSASPSLYRFEVRKNRIVGGEWRGTPGSAR